jgi:hypothetical protein
MNSSPVPNLDKVNTVKPLTILFFMLMTTSSSAQILGEKERRDLKGSISASCFTAQRASPINTIASDTQIRYYCTCYAEEIILPNTTVQDFHRAVEALQRSGADAMLSVLLKGRNIHAIANSCSAQAFQFSE